MTVFGVVFERNKKELIHKDALFLDKAEAEEECRKWNDDIPACESRPAVVEMFNVTGE